MQTAAEQPLTVNAIASMATFGSSILTVEEAVSAIPASMAANLVTDKYGQTSEEFAFAIVSKTTHAPIFSMELATDALESLIPILMSNSQIVEYVSVRMGLRLNRLTVDRAPANV